MSNSRRVILAVVTTLTLVATIWAIYPATGNAQTAAATQTAAAAQTAAPLSVSGKITSIKKDSFTLAVGGSQTGGQQLAQTAETKSMTFVIDKNTTIEGKLKLNANADVTYREDGGKNIAISVHVAA